MRVLFDHPSPFALTHGGFQTQIEQTAAALRSIGVEVEFLRWWDDTQRGDLIHYFGRPTQAYIQFAQKKGIRVVILELLTALGSRSRLERQAQKTLIRLAQQALPAAFTARLGWGSYQAADAIIANTPWEAGLMREMFKAPVGRLHVVGNGVEAVFLESTPAPRGPWLVCTATLTERKRVLHLAEAAVAARTPVWIIGRPYSDDDPYASRFENFARRHTEWVRYEGAIQSRSLLAKVYREARGFVLLSTMETLSLSADEAAACECPLLLSDLPWARSVFGKNATYCPIVSSGTRTASVLKSFYHEAPRRPIPRRPPTWSKVATQLSGIYQRLLSTSR